jgi:hypothetical protein
MILTDVFSLHYQQFIFQIEGTEEEAKALEDMLNKKFKTGKEGETSDGKPPKSRFRFVVLIRGKELKGGNEK